MSNEIFSLWYKQPAMLTSLPEMALMIKKEGVEGYGLYMTFADSLHISGGYREYNLNDISLVLDCNKKRIKTKLKKVLDDYGLFDFYVDGDGIELIGLQRVREDVETLTKQKLDGAKGGRKRAKNQVEKQINEVKLKEEIPKEVKEVKPEMTHQEQELMFQAVYFNGD
tara:strand:- start:518 stop:1021 length:504 start_codon:yes stop_codon:yes gene_type:complete